MKKQADDSSIPPWEDAGESKIIEFPKRADCESPRTDKVYGKLPFSLQGKSIEFHSDVEIYDEDDLVGDGRIITYSFHLKEGGHIEFDVEGDEVVMWDSYGVDVGLHWGIFSVRSHKPGGPRTTPKSWDKAMSELKSGLFRKS